MLLPEIYPVTCHTSHVGPGSTFVAIKGFSEDGTAYIKVALEKGASTIVVESSMATIEIDGLCKQYHAQYIITPNARQTLAEIANKALGNPSEKLKIIGITGTKGKTTTAYLVEHVLRHAGYKTALLSTITNRIVDDKEPGGNTTPGSDYLHMFFAECVKHEVDYVVMEVSSHALSLHRVHGIAFDGIGFTNLAPEHMDFYGTLDDYFAAKAQIFGHLKKRGVVAINVDDAWGKKAFTAALDPAHTMRATLVGFGRVALQDLPITMQHKYSPFTINQTSFAGINLSLTLQQPFTITCPTLFGAFNCYNTTMASLLCFSLGIAPRIIARAMETFPGVPGRLQRHVMHNGAHAFVDYAHNPSSFHEVLSTLRPFTHHLIVVFGCGGGRDKIKRPVMGQIAAHFGDIVIVTNDNPRFEDPAVIINEIMAGIPAEHQTKVLQEPDRRKAIATAAALSGPHSIIALLGKGHEPYYLVQGQTFHFDDREEIETF